MPSNSPQPTAPDEIRHSGHRTVLFQYERFKFVCDCLKGPKHVTYCTFDQMPPNYCPGNRRMYKDHGWVDPDYRPNGMVPLPEAPATPSPDWDIPVVENKLGA